MPASEIVLATTINTANEDQGSEMVAISRQVAQHRCVVIVVACGGHEAKRIAGARLLTEIISCSVNREDVEQHHLARSELNVDSLTFIHFTLVERDPEYQVLAISARCVLRLALPHATQAGNASSH